MAPERSAEQQAKKVLGEVECDLCRHLEVTNLDQDFLAELYLRVLDELRFHPACKGGEEELSSALALTIYLVAASQQRGARASPELIPRLERAIARALSPSGSGQSDRVEGSG